MIADGAITYANKNGDFLSWRFSNDVLNELAIATLLTILSYQVAETLLNLCFGIKQCGQAKLSDLHIMLLIRKSSPMASLKSIFSRKSTPKQVQFDLEYQDDEYPSELETDSRSNSRVYTKLIFLLLAIPIVNIIAVVLSLERDTTISFADANFGGLALGLDRENTISQWSPLSSSPKNTCQSTELRINTAEFAIADFSICTQDVTHDPSTASNDSIIEVITDITTGRSADSAFVTVRVGSQRVEYTKRAMFITMNSTMSEEDRNLYVLKVNLLEEDGEFLTTRGLNLAKRHCDSTDDQEKRRRATAKGRISLSQSLECRQESERSEAEDLESARAVAMEMLQPLSFVNSDELLVKNVDEEDSFQAIRGKFLPGNDLLLLKRRRGFVSIPILAIAALAALFLRAISDLLTKNDLEKAIGLILRDGLGLPCCDSMLSSKDVVAQYDSEGKILYAIERECNRMHENKLCSCLDFNSD